MAKKDPELQAISKIARALEDISTSDRTFIMSFVKGISGPTAAKAAARLAEVLGEVDESIRERVLELFTKRVAEAYYREHGNGEEAAAAKA